MYANFGTEEDFGKLKDLGVSVKNKIVIIRQGRIFRGNKVRSLPPILPPAPASTEQSICLLLKNGTLSRS